MKPDRDTDRYYSTLYDSRLAEESYAEIAAVMGITVGQVAMIERRALAKLKRRLERLGIGPGDIDYREPITRKQW